MIFQYVRQSTPDIKLYFFTLHVTVYQFLTTLDTISFVELDLSIIDTNNCVLVKNVISHYGVSSSRRLHYGTVTA